VPGKVGRVKTVGSVPIWAARAGRCRARQQRTLVWQTASVGVMGWTRGQHDQGEHEHGVGKRGNLGLSWSIGRSEAGHRERAAVH
jgi:hypothetical protein